MSVKNYHYSLHNKLEECSSQLLRSGNLKPRKFLHHVIKISCNRTFLLSSFFENLLLNTPVENIPDSDDVFFKVVEE
jgi:hypothetical protein